MTTFEALSLIAQFSLLRYWHWLLLLSYFCTKKV